jgi:hypothetical protein
VKELPGNIDQRELARILHEQWGLAPGRLCHLPVGSGDDARAAGRYTELTGHRVSSAAMDLYRLRWSLDDIALSVRDFRAPHEQNEGIALMWDAITEEIGEIG